MCSVRGVIRVLAPLLPPWKSATGTYVKGAETTYVVE